MGDKSMRDAEQPYDMPGRTCFLQVDDRIFRTYSVYARGLESTGGSYYFLDLTALGRQEDWEEPKGRSDSAARQPARLPRIAVSRLSGPWLSRCAQRNTPLLIVLRSSCGAAAEDVGAHPVHARVVGRGLGGQLGEVAGQAEVAGVGQLGGPLGEPAGAAGEGRPPRRRWRRRSAA